VSESGVLLTLFEAQTELLGGAKFGDVYPRLGQPERFGPHLKAFFAYDPRLPASAVSTPPAAREAGFSGDVCERCQGSRMRRNGSCLLCSDCGETTGCS
jgi:hypothetical protein